MSVERFAEFAGPGQRAATIQLHANGQWVRFEDYERDLEAVRSNLTRSKQRAQRRAGEIKVRAARAEAQLEALREAVEYAEGQLRGGSAVGLIPQENAERAYSRLAAALDEREEKP